ncbi:AT-hook motif nuclear-localized protein 10 [Vitis vinifera]|uniref:AT-hook motif nuclear-localized protein n=1 Tax=Vitis vinifera TaxID=29760 RepID=A0A438EQC0_VITVI|nr:AT-hook motif nuclear-localized protein 10 [Vitis vinifera]
MKLFSWSGIQCLYGSRFSGYFVQCTQGRFDIISLSGSFLLSEDNGSRHRTGGLSVSLAGSDGRVLGGGVAGMLTAATPVQLHCRWEENKYKSVWVFISTSSQMLNFGAPVVPASPSQGGSSESSDENGGSPLNRGPLPYNNVSQPIHQMPMYAAMGWPNSTMKMLPN